MKVLKFGGSSVATATNMSRVLDIVSDAASEGKVILVCSAISGCTDALLSLAGSMDAAESIRECHEGIIRRLFTGVEREEALKEFEALYSEMLASPAEEKPAYGELFSTRILARKLAAEGYGTLWLDSRELIVKGDLSATYDNIRTAISGSPRRGGGVVERDRPWSMNGWDPSVSLGGTRAQSARRWNDTTPSAGDVKIFVAPGFIAGDGKGHVTTLGRGGSDYSAALYAAGAEADALEIWTDVPGMMSANPKVVPAASTIPSLSYRAALELAENGAKVLYAPTVKPAMDAGIAFSIRNTFNPSHQGTVIGDNPFGSGWAGITSSGGRLCLVSEGPIREKGAAVRIKDVLRRAGIDIKKLEIRETFVYIDVDAAAADDAVRAVHRDFFELSPRDTIDLYVAGAGAVGKALAELIFSRSKEVAARRGKVLRIAGIADSRHFLIDPEGLGMAQLEALESSGRRGNFIDAVLETAPRSAWFVDCTDSTEIWRDYVRIREAGLNIVSSNRRSFAVPYAEYIAIKTASASTLLRYEATVGASLPMLEPLSRSADASDGIISIEAVVSCTLNRILSGFEKGEGSFAGLLRAAQEDGLTEPDPRTDLAGRDALMKLLILSREAGVPLDASDVVIEPIVEPAEGSIEDFYKALQESEAELEARRDAALSRGCHLRFTAALEQSGGDYKARIAVREVPQNHPAYHLEGTENAILIRTVLHPAPLLIQGAGEGARLAAATILSDILR